MTDAQALKAYRSFCIELSAIQAQIRQTERSLTPRKTLTQRYDATPGTNDPTAAAMQLLDGLEALADRKRAQMEALRPQIDSLLAQQTDYKLLVILQRYYLHGDTDEQIASLLSLTDRYICRLRNAFLRKHDAPLHTTCTSIASSLLIPAQESTSAALSVHTPM